MPRLWILPVNDGEMAEIARLLAEHGEETLISRQPWGARWDGLEPAILSAMAANRGSEIIGVELAGSPPPGARNIDHHRYPGDDRSHPLSSLEQIADLLKAPLSRWQQLVAANDRGYIPAMQALGASAEEIDAVRRHDRAAQGVTPEDEVRAERDLARARLANGLLVVDCPDGHTSAHSDRAHGLAPEILLASPRQWLYYGPRHRQLADETFPEPTWSGGAPASGYWGITAPEPASRERVMALLTSAQLQAI